MPSTHGFDRSVASVARRQHALITYQQALDVGGSRRQIEHRVATGRWTQFEHGVYLLAGAQPTWMTRVLSVCLACGGITSHRTSAVLWGLEGFRPGPPELTIARGRTFRRTGVRTHESSDLALASTTMKDGILTTGIDRLLVDLGAVCPVEVVEEAIFDAINRKLIDWPDIWQALVLHARRGRNGIGRLRAVLERNYGMAVPESKLEIIFERLLDDAGFPRLDRQIKVHDERGEIGRIDYGYISRRVLFEIDGRSVHARREAFVADNEKRNRLHLAGWFLLVFTSEMLLRRPTVVCAQVRQAIDDHPPLHGLILPGRSVVHRPPLR
jgi:very-short-patch-repair endonuclease